MDQDKRFGSAIRWTAVALLFANVFVFACAGKNGDPAPLPTEAGANGDALAPCPDAAIPNVCDLLSDMCADASPSAAVACTAMVTECRETGTISPPDPCNVLNEMCADKAGAAKIACEALVAECRTRGNEG